MTYFILSGTEPFAALTCYDVYNKIRTADFKFDAPVWDKISNEGKDFI